MKRIIFLKTLFLLILFFLTTGALANGRSGHLPKNRWHGGDIRRFEINDRGRWSHGHWRHTTFEGRFGWWWVVGTSWYFYSRPTYPYPDPYRPTMVIEVEKTTQLSPPTTPTSQSWYYCEASKDYYPYVTTCPAGWKIVPVTPPGSKAPAQ
jgi:hypothetical protein